MVFLQQQRTSLQQPEIIGNTNFNNENQEQGGDDSVNNATRGARKNLDTGRQITTRTGTGKVAGYNEPGTEDCLGLASVPTITYLREQPALRDTKIVAMEQSISQLKQAVRDLQQRSWQPMLIIDMPDMQQPIKFLGSYKMSHQVNNNKWGCTSTANDKSGFSGVKDDEHVADKVNTDNTTPRDGQLQQYNKSTPQTRGTRRRKMNY